ncbi:hypothetical protein [Streptomyces sp. NPDC001978]|uniref:hypothetical protein n=1 Tax=Streptomyces sp. NPDC001978 TaxID=3364627 RepID=UPI003676A907
MTTRLRQDSPLPLGRGPALHTVPPDASAGQVTSLRAIAQINALRVHDWPAYGSLPWLKLKPDDPKVYAATLEAAELHRRHVERIYNDAHTRALNVLQTAAEVRAARKGTTRTREPREVTATPGWPPIAIPGRPGWYRHLINGEQVDLPTNKPQESSA